MEELCAFLLKNLVLDLDGSLDMDKINTMLARDASQMSSDLRARLITEQGVSAFLLVLLDCLRESIRDGITVDRVREQVVCYLDA